jgi:hypothetical protein
VCKNVAYEHVKPFHNLVRWSTSYSVFFAIVNLKLFYMANMNKDPSRWKVVVENTRKTFNSPSPTFLGRYGQP